MQGISPNFLIPHLFVQSGVFLERNSLLLNDFLEFVSSDLRALFFDLFSRGRMVSFVASVHFEVEIGRHAHGSRALAVLRAERLQVEDILVSTMRDILPRFRLQSSEVNRTLVVLASTRFIIEDVGAVARWFGHDWQIIHRTSRIVGSRNFL